MEAIIKERTAKGESSHMQQHEYDNVVKALKSVPGQSIRNDFNILHCTGEKPEVSKNIITIKEFRLKLSTLNLVS